MDLPEPGEVGVPQIRCLSVVDSELTGQPEGRQAVGQSIAHGLDVAALLGGHVLDLDAVDQGGDVAVQVLPAAEGLDQRLVRGQVRHDAHLDLGVVGGHEALVALADGEGLSDAHPLLVTGRDVLQVGVGGGQASRGGDGLLEGGVDAPVGLDGLAQSLNRLPQLDGVAVLKKVLQEGVGGLGVQPGQGIGVGGVAGLGLAGLGHLQLVEQDGLELLGAGEVELSPGGGVGALGSVGHPGVELGLAGMEHGVVDGDAGVLHDGQGRCHGHLQVGEQSGGVTSRHLLIEHGLEREQGGGPARTGQVGGGNGLLRGEGLEVECALRLTGAAVTPGTALVDCRQVDAEPTLGESLNVIAALLRTAQVSGQRGICDDAVERESPGAQRVPAALGVGDELGTLHVGQEPSQDGFVLWQDLGQVDGDRPRAVGQ